MVKKTVKKEKEVKAPKVEAKKEKQVVAEVIKITFKGGSKEFSKEVDGEDYVNKANAFSKDLR